MNCLNCNNPLRAEDKYCPQCSQKVAPLKPKLRHLIAEFFENLLNIDKGLLPTLKMIFIPGALTTAFFKGKRARYFRPMRLLLITGIAFIWAFSVDTSNEMEEFRDFANWFSEDKIELENVQTLLTQRNKYNKNIPVYEDSVYVAFLKALRPSRIDSNKNSIPADSAALEAMFIDSTTLFLLIGKDGGSFFDQLLVSYVDIATYTPDELVEKYKIEGWVNRMAFRQTVKFLSDMSYAVRYFIGAILWTFFLLIPGVSLILFVLYGVRKTYYIEHFVFASHAHASLFFFMTLSFLINHYIGVNLHSITILIYGFWLFIALKRFYKRGWIRTLIYNVIVNFFYLILINLSLLLSMFIRFLLL